MSYLDSYLHTHRGSETIINFDNQYDGLHLINIHSLYMYNNFLNISAQMGNNIFYYQSGPNLSITIPDGNYNVQTFNKYLLTTPAALFRVVQSYDGLYGQVCKYANSSDRTQDINRIVQNVDSLSVLNQEIVSGIVWTERILLFCDVIKNGQNIQTGNTNIQQNVSEGQNIIIPIQGTPGSHQTFSYYTEMGFEFLNKNSLRIYFTREDFKNLVFPEYLSFYSLPRIQFTFDEEKHSM